MYATHPQQCRYLAIIKDYWILTVKSRVKMNNLLFLIMRTCVLGIAQHVSCNATSLNMGLKIKNSCQILGLSWEGVANGTSKTLAKTNFSSDLEILTAFGKSFKGSFILHLFWCEVLHTYVLVSVSVFSKQGSRCLGESRILPFITCELL